jgi:hypothetical protein
MDIALRGKIILPPKCRHEPAAFHLNTTPGTTFATRW